MRKWNAYITAVVFCFCTVYTKGQYDPSFTHYWMMEPQFNPAAAGSTEYMRIVGAYSAQMSGYQDAPKTMFFGADLPAFFLKPNHGLGALFLNDEIGLFSHKRFSVQYAYRFKLFGGRLGLGVQCDLLNEGFDGSKADVGQSNDPAFATANVSGSHVDAAFGLYYRQKNWYAGVSVQHFTAPTVTLGETNQIKVDRTYYLTAGYNINLRNPFLTIKPSVLAVYDGKEYRTNISGRVEYANDEKMMFGGATYSPEHSAALFIGGKFHGVVLSYSYEAYTSGVGIEHGTHELILSYEMKLNFYKKGKNLHKSVRLL